MKLQRFLNVQLNKAKKGQIDDTKISMLFELVSKYKYEKRKRLSPTNMNESYSNLIDFVSKNRRLPKANFKDEKILYGFFYRQRKLFREQNLSSELKEKFIEIANLLNPMV